MSKITTSWYVPTSPPTRPVTVNLLSLQRDGTLVLEYLTALDGHPTARRDRTPVSPLRLARLLMDRAHHRYTI